MDEKKIKRERKKVKTERRRKKKFEPKKKIAVQWKIYISFVVFMDYNIMLSS